MFVEAYPPKPKIRFQSRFMLMIVQPCFLAMSSIAWLKVPTPVAGSPLSRTIGILAGCVVMHHQYRQSCAVACLDIFQHLLVVAGGITERCIRPVPVNHPKVLELAGSEVIQ